VIFRTWLVTLGTQRHLSEQEAHDTSRGARSPATLDFDRIWITRSQATPAFWQGLMPSDAAELRAGRGRPVRGADRQARAHP